MATSAVNVLVREAGNHCLSYSPWTTLCYLHHGNQSEEELTDKLTLSHSQDSGVALFLSGSFTFFMSFFRWECETLHLPFFGVLLIRDLISYFLQTVVLVDHWDFQASFWWWPTNLQQIAFCVFCSSGETLHLGFFWVLDQWIKLITLFNFVLVVHWDFQASFSWWPINLQQITFCVCVCVFC